MSDPGLGPGASAGATARGRRARRRRSEARAGGEAGVPADGPRERLGALGAGSLSEAELLALLLRTGSAGDDAVVLARQLLGRFGGLDGLAGEGLPGLVRARGVGAAKAASLVAAFELGRRRATRRLAPGARIRGPEDVHGHFHARLRDCAQEHFLALTLDGRQRLLGEIAVSAGTLTASLVHPREVFRSAVRQAAAGLVLVHNHPSGDPSPSGEDGRVTERLVAAGELLGIRVLDHVIVAERGFYSFRQAGRLQPEGNSSAPVGDSLREGRTSDDESGVPGWRREAGTREADSGCRR